MPDSDGLIIDPNELVGFDPTDAKQAEKLGPMLQKGIQVGVPFQAVVGAHVEKKKKMVWADARKKDKVEKEYDVYVIDPKPFHKQFYILYQITKEVADGSRWDFRVFFRDVNGRNLMQKVGLFCFEFVDEYFEPIKGEFNPPITAEMLPSKVKWQQDFLCRNVPGRYIEMIFDRFFEHLYKVFS